LGRARYLRGLRAMRASPKLQDPSEQTQTADGRG
jgi:hypothetical protein